MSDPTFRKAECYVPTCPTCGADLLDGEEMVPHCEHPWLGPDDPEAEELRCATCDPIPYAPIERSADGTERAGWPGASLDRAVLDELGEFNPSDPADRVAEWIEAAGTPVAGWQRDILRQHFSPAPARTIMSSGSWAYEVFVRALAAGTVEAPRDADPDNFAIVPADFPIGEALTRVTRQRPVLVVVSDEDDIEIYLPRRVWP